MASIHCINKGDVYKSHCKDSDIEYKVIGKSFNMIKVKTSYKNPLITEPIWVWPTNKIFDNKIYDGKKCELVK